MFPQSTRELVWQGDWRGLRDALLDAQEIELNGDAFSAIVMRASALYSYAHGIAAIPRLLQARRYAERAAVLARTQGMKSLAHGQCDIIGTILLRRAVWRAPMPGEALKFFVTGLNKPGVPPHSRALMLIGKAETQEMLPHFRPYAQGNLEAALVLQNEVLHEADLVFARRQFVRVLRRAMALGARLHPLDLTVAAGYRMKAEELARQEPDEAVRMRMLKRIAKEWNRVS